VAWFFWKFALTNSYWHCENISFPEVTKGFHLVTEIIVSSLPQIKYIEVGLLHLMLQHTSASLSINENADPSVRHDLESYVNHSVNKYSEYFTHLYEGADDMPAHIKSSLFGCQLTIPIQQGQLALGTWQGILLGEHRKNGGRRRVIATLHGVRKA
jgi:secondary thiamine-phosphate synthase enzyme